MVGWQAAAAVMLCSMHCHSKFSIAQVGTFLSGCCWGRASAGLRIIVVICNLCFVFCICFVFVFFILHRWRPFYQGAAGSSWAWSRPSKVHPPAHETRKMVSIEGTRGAAVITCRGFVRINYTLEAPFCPPYHKPVIITTRRKIASIGGNQRGGCDNLQRFCSDKPWFGGG